MKQLHSKNTDDWTKKGDAFFDLEKYDEAIKCYDKALRLIPKMMVLG